VPGNSIGCPACQNNDNNNIASLTNNNNSLNNIINDEYNGEPGEPDPPKPFEIADDTNNDNNNNNNENNNGNNDTTEVADLLKEWKWSEQLLKALRRKYGDVIGREMSRQMRSSKIKISEEALKQKAENKIAQREMESQFAKGSKSTGSGSLNTKGTPVSNIRHGIGQGYLAGEGARWHVHHDHVKWGDGKKTRINFKGRSRSDILNAFAPTQPSATSMDRPSWDACWEWMLNNL
jgi:hypothetical protein